MGRHPLNKYSAWDVTFTEKSQMPWQLIRGLECQLYQYPEFTVRGTVEQKHTRTHTPQNRQILFSVFMGGKLCGWNANINIISMSQSRTRTEKRNEYITSTITE